MLKTDPRVDNILAALEKFSTSLNQQLEFNQHTDQRIAAVINRLDQLEDRFSQLATLIQGVTSMPTSSSNTSLSQDNSGPQHPASTPKQTAESFTGNHQPKSNNT